MSDIKHLRDLLKICSVLPVLAVLPAMAGNVNCSGATCLIEQGDTWDVLTSTRYTGDLSGDGTVLVREGDKTDVILFLQGSVADFSGVFASNQHASNNPEHPGNWTPTIVFTKWAPSQTFNLTTTANAAGDFVFAGTGAVKIASSANQGRVFLNGNVLDRDSVVSKITHIFTGAGNAGADLDLAFDGYNLEMGNLYIGDSNQAMNGNIKSDIRNSRFYGLYASGQDAVVNGNVEMELKNVVASDRVVGLMANGGHGSIIYGDLTIDADNVTAPGIFGQQISMNSANGKTGVTGSININVENSTVGEVRGSTTPHVNGWATWVPENYIGARQINIDIEDSVIEKEVIAVGNYLNAGNVNIDVSGNTWIGYTRSANGEYVKTRDADGWIIAGAQRPGGRVDNTMVRLDTDGGRNTINIAGDVNVGSRQKSAPDNSDTDSVAGNAVLSILGGGTVNIDGDLRAYNVQGDSALNLENVKLKTAGEVVEFKHLDVAGDAVWQNEGALTLRDGAVMNSAGTITGGGVLTVENGATLNAGVSSIKQGKIILDGILNAELRNEAEYATFDVDSFTGDGRLNLTVGRAGNYDIFKNDRFDSKSIDVTSNPLFNINFDDNNMIVASVKSASEIAAVTGMSTMAAQTVSVMSMATSDTLNDLVVQTQRALADGDVVSVEHAAAALNPENTPLAQSVATEIRNSVGNVVSLRLADMGRKLGDIAYGVSHVWAQGLLNKTDNGSTFDYSMRGIAAGLDVIVNDDFTFGAGYAFHGADASLRAHDADIDANTLFAYGQYKPARWYVNAMAHYTMAKYDYKSYVFGNRVTADRDVDSYGVQAKAGYELANGVTPELGLSYMHLDLDKFNNSMDLSATDTDADFVTASAGAKYSLDVAPFDSFLLRPQAHMALNYDVVSQVDDISVIVPGAPSYELAGKRLNRFGAELGAGLSVVYGQMEIGLNYDLELRGHYTSHTGSLNARYRF